MLRFFSNCVAFSYRLCGNDLYRIYCGCIGGYSQEISTNIVNQKNSYSIFSALLPKIAHAKKTFIRKKPTELEKKS